MTTTPNTQQDLFSHNDTHQTPPRSAVDPALAFESPDLPETLDFDADLDVDELGEGTEFAPAEFDSDGFEDRSVPVAVFMSVEDYEASQGSVLMPALN